MLTGLQVLRGIKECFLPGRHEGSHLQILKRMSVSCTEMPTMCFGSEEARGTSSPSCVLAPSGGVLSGVLPSLFFLALPSASTRDTSSTSNVFSSV